MGRSRRSSAKSLRERHHGRDCSVTYPGTEIRNLGAKMEQQGNLRPLDVGVTISQAFALVGRYPVKIFGAALIAGAIPLRVISYVMSGYTAPGIPAGINSLPAFFASIMIHTVVAGLLVGSAVDQDTGRGSGLRRLPQLFAAGLLAAVGSIIALLCLLIPYLFLITRWSVVGPVVASENISINQAFGRSSQLSEGARLRILGIIVLAGVGESLLVIAGMLLVAAFSGVETALQEFSLQPAAMTMRIAVQTLTIGFTGALHCALYVQLKERREGPRADQLREIFA